MDWTLAIERNREALKRILAMLVAMAGLADSFTSPLWGGRRSSDRRVGVIVGSQPPPDASRRPPHKGEVKPALTLPRHLYRAILRLLRPAESAARRLIIVMARGVTLPPPRKRKPKPASAFLSKPGGTGIYLPPGAQASGSPSPLCGLRDRSSDRASGSIVGREGRGDCEAIGVPGKIREASGGGPAARTPSLPLLDPLRPPFRPRRPAQSSVPRISFPGVTAPSLITPRRPPTPDDPLDATRLGLRLQALGAALDDLPGQARRFARWRARGMVAAGTQDKRQHTGRARRTWPLRPGRPPGQRTANRRTHEVHEILNDLHDLAFEVLEHPDTS